LPSDEWTEAHDVIEEIREIRRQICARFDNDHKKLIEHYIEHDKQLPPSRIAPPRQRHGGESAA
jgi:hypothetical protein